MTRFSKFSKGKRQLVDEMLKKQGVSAVVKIPQRKGPYPLSFAQQRLWFLDRLQPGSAAYNIPLTVRITGNLDVEVLKRSLREIFTRHDALRTRYLAGARPEQVAVAGDLQIREIEILEKRDEALAVLQREIDTPFDLCADPLLKVTLAKIDKREHLLLVLTHHIAFDGSAQIFFRELAEIYHAFAQKQPSPLLPLPVQYGDFAAWQRDWLQGKVLAEQLNYWKRRLKHMPPPLNLPTDYKRPSVHSFRGAARFFQLSPQLCEALEAFARERGVSMFIIGLAVFKALLVRYSSQSDIAVGTPINNRPTSETREMIGCFVNTLTMRSDLSGDPSFLEVVSRVKETAHSAYSHQDLPFEMLVDALELKRDLSHTPLFQVMFVLQHYPDLKIPGLEIELVELRTHGSRFDMLWSLAETKGAIKAMVEYDTDLWDAPTVDRMFEHFGNLLDDSLAHPRKKLSELRMLSAMEYEKITGRWNDTAQKYSKNLCLHQLFENRVEQAPDATALAWTGGAWSYRKLNEEANCIAYLLKKCIAPGDLVAVYMPRQPHCVAALLGILKAGGTYVPLEMTYPPARVSAILSRHEITRIITLASALPTLADLFEENSIACSDILCLDMPLGVNQDALKRLREKSHVWTAKALDSLGKENLENRSLPRQPAYIIFTSGSTGVPKGVVVEHRAAVNVIEWVNQTFAITPDDCLLFITSLCFDLSVYDIFGTLAAGATIRMALEKEAKDPQKLLDMLCREKITFWDSAPATLQQLLPFLENFRTQASKSRLRLVFLSGDWIPLPLPDQIRNFFPTAKVISLGGATEATVWSNYYPIEQRKAHWSSIPYGRPIHNARYYVLDQTLTPCPIGVPGDLYIGGECLSLGYAKDPAQTALRYRPDPFSCVFGARMYDTGDRARFFADGNLEFLGRRDNQVKIRGFRIELGEIETTLSQHPKIREAVAVVRENMPGQKRLLCYLVGDEVEPKELRDFAASRLPEYMLPTFVFLKTMPLTANGKVDRKRLPAPALDIPGQKRTERPANPIEKDLAKIWQEVLHLKHVGRSDNFFALGGDSILSLQIVSRANQKGLAITPQDMFQRQTIAELAECSMTKNASLEIAHGDIEITPIQRWFFAKNLPCPKHWNQSVLLQLKPETDIAILQTAVSEVVKHHEMLRCRYFLENGAWRQQVPKKTPEIAVESVDLCDLSPDKQKRQMEAMCAAAQRSLDLESGKLLTAVHFGLDRQEYLLIVIHHLVIDGVSWRILLSDLALVYRQIAEKKPVALPAKTTPYRKWAKDLIDYAQGEEIEKQAGFWLDMLESDCDKMTLDFPDGENSESSQKSVSIKLSRGKTRELLVESAKAYHARANELLLTALCMALSRWDGDKGSWLVDIEGHGRGFRDYDLTQTVGWFTAICPLLLSRCKEQKTGDAIKATKERLRSLPGEGAIYGILRYLSKDSQLRAKLERLQTEISFNYLGRFHIDTTSFIEGLAENHGPERSPAAKRTHILNISAAVSNDELKIQFGYSENLHRQQSIDKLALHYYRALEEIAEYCMGNAGGFIPSDFPLAKLEQGQLDVLTGPAENVQDIYPLSPMQQGMLFHTLLSPHSGVYFQQIRFKVDKLDIATFKKAWQKIIAAESMLRTSFHWSGLSEPLQIVHTRAELPLAVFDWRDKDKKRQARDLKDLCAAEEKKGFDLEQAPAMKIITLRLTENTYQVIWNMHHLLFDGWSLPTLAQKLFFCYRQILDGQEPLLSAPPYRRYIEWLLSQDKKAAATYWRDYLRGVDITQLGIEKTLARSSEIAYAASRSTLESELVEKLRRMAQSEHITVNTVFQGAWALLLSRYGRNRDVLFGVTTSGRSASVVGIEEMTGLFINTLPLRVKVDKDMPLPAYLARIQQDNIQARNYEYSSLIEIKKSVDIASERDIFANIMVFENFPLEESFAEGKSIAVYDLEIVEKTNYPLAITIIPGENYIIEASYDANIYEAGDISSLLKRLQRVIEQMAVNPGQNLAEINILSEEERKTSSTILRGEPLLESEKKLFLQHFAQRVENFPDDIALTREEVSLSYRMLDTESNRLAHYLKNNSLRQYAEQAIIGVFLERSIDSLVAAMAVMKASAAYLPLAVDQSAERLAFVLKDANVKVVLTREGLREKLAGCNVEIICLDDKREIIARESAGTVPANIVAQNLAYVIYTSGSTGLPKGVAVSHGSLASVYAGWKRAYALCRGDIHLQMADFTFDVFVGDMARALASGGRLVLCPKDTLVDAAKLYRLMIREKVNCAEFVPLVIKNLAAYLREEKHSLDFMRLLIVGSDSWLISEFEEIRKICGENTRLVNSYGLTEATVDTSYFEPDALTLSADKVVPIGRPFPGASMYLLDESLRPVPKGIAGKLYIAGTGLAKGYLNRPALTACTYVPDPFDKRPGARMLCTGDLARCLADGNLEFLGRADRQVKIRGLRIELGEIEAALKRHPNVLEAAVSAFPDGDGKSLTAYLTAKEDLPDDAKMRAFLKDRLANHAIPRYFVKLKSMPLTPSGKVDYRALPTPDIHESGEDFVAPQTATQELIAGVFSSVLQCGPVGAHSDFFALGGHSLTATQATSRICEIFRQDLPLRAIFDNSEVALLANYIEETRSAGRFEVSPISIADRDGELPLSFAQSRLWFLQHLDPKSGAYNIPAAIEIRGPLRKSILQRSFLEMIRRHEILRTNFPESQGKPRQLIAKEPEFSLQTVDCEQIPPLERKSHVQRLIAERAGHPFDLAGEPLLRVTLFRLEANRHVLFINMHHIISDAWSSDIFIRELATLYESGDPTPLPLDVQYADFACWQRQWLIGETLEPQLQYWKDRLGDLPPPLELPFDYPRPAVQTFRGARHTINLGKKLSDEINAFSHKQGVTQFMTLLAAYCVLLHKYTHVKDIAIGSPIAGRNRGEIENTIGFFANTLTFRNDLSGDPSFDELLQRVRETALSAYANQDLPFERLVDELHPRRDLSHTPLFQVMFVLQNASPTIELKDLEITSFEIENRTCKFDLTLTVSENIDGFDCCLEYSSDLFARQTILRMIEHYRQIVKSIVDKPGQKLSELEILTGEEKHRLLVGFNPQKNFAKTTITRVFENQAAKTPDSVALVYEGKTLSYRELDAMADNIAYYLQSKGIGAETPVGICLERGLQIPVAILGVLKAGAAYLPLDPAYPKQRIDFIAADSKMPMLLTQHSLLNRLPKIDGRVICVEDIANSKDRNLKIEIFPDNLAYIIYTSGSTGRPKGTPITHHQVMRLFHATYEHFHFDKYDVWTLFHSFAFDFSVWEIWGALLYGGRLIIVPQESTRSFPDFYRLLAKEKVTVLSQTPSAFRQLIQVDESIPEPLALRLVIFGGETLEFSDLRPWIKRHGDRPELVNMYGITETTVHVTHRLISRRDIERGKSYIGHPISDMKVFLLDENLMPVPIGVPGEICVSGDGVGRGYLDMPALTAEKFTPAPWSGERIYRSGDLGRFLPDGDIEYLGRKDRQVKIRGFRIELGEIAVVLQEHPMINQAVVTVRDWQKDRRLVAYLVSASTRPTVDKLRSFAKKRLPDYMIPAHWVFLTAMPLTSHGKIDHGALPAPNITPKHITAPRTPTEEMIANIWSEVLQIEQVDVCRDFFELGGHSLLVMQVISRLRSHFQIDAPVSALFKNPTVGKLAAFVEEKRCKGKLPALTRVDRDKDLPLSFGQERLWFLHQMAPNSSAYNIPIAIHVSGEPDVLALKRAFNEIMRRHEAMRTVFNTSDIPRQIILPESEVNIPVIDLRRLPESERKEGLQKALAAEAAKPIDLLRGPVVRMHLYRFGEKDYALSLVTHHIVADGSVDLLLSDLFALYRSFVSGEPPSLPDLPIQYADFAQWQKQWLRGETLAKQVDYWKQRLAGLTPLDLPGDYPRLAVYRYRGAACSVHMNKTVKGLRTLCRECGVTPFMATLAVFKLLLSRYTGRNDIAVGSPINDRSQLETENLVGNFVNTLVLRTELKGDLSFRCLLKRVRETTLGAYANKDAPFEMLVEKLQPKRDLGHTPLFQVMFTFQHPPLESMQLPGISLRPLSVQSGRSRFDLLFSLWENRQDLSGTLEYNTDLLSPATAKRIVEHYQVLLDAAICDPDAKISTLPLLSEKERRYFTNWNKTDAAIPDKCLHQLFAEQVERDPHAVATHSDGQSITYRQLDSRAASLARLLCSLSIGKDTLVAVYLDRSTDMISAVLGILKSGAAYVPIDTSYPKARVQYILDSLKIGCIVAGSAQIPTIEAMKPHLPALAHIVCQDAKAPLKSLGLNVWTQCELKEKNEGALPDVSPDNLAYIIFTSGSTGAPKGVMVCHRPAVNVISWVNSTFELGSRDQLLFITSLCFDLSVYDIFGPLAAGASIRIASDEEKRDPQRLLDILYREPITFWDSAPAALQQLTAFFDGSQSLRRRSKLRLVFLSGDWIPVPLPDQMRAEFLRARVISLGGATEATVWSNFYLVERTDPKWTSIPYGRPISNARYYVLDENLCPCPIGVPGDLYIGGECLALGYAGQAALSASKFVPDPFGRLGARMYFTGDRVRHRLDGNLEFLGRLDCQVKIRGYRIELGEIETVLSQHPAVRECVVDVRGAGKELVAYPVAAENPVENDLLIAYLRQRLPDYMMPSAIVWINAILLTANGKVDRKALPNPHRRTLERKGIGLADSLEKDLSEIWRRVLEVKRVEIGENFFELGGHSLKVTQVISLVRKELEVEMSMHEFFANTTVAAQAKVLRAKNPSRYIPIEKARDAKHYPLSRAQFRLWLLCQIESGQAAYNIPGALSLKGKLDKQAVAEVFQKIGKRHEILRTTFCLVDNAPRQVVGKEPLIDFSCMDFRGKQRVKEEARKHAARVFDLESGPLFSACLLQTGDDEHILLFNTHHIISDAWSLHILVDEFCQLYQNRGEHSENLPPLDIQYRDYAIWEERFLQSENLRPHRDYWLEKFSGELPILDFPTDFAPKAPTNRGGDLSLSLPVSLTQTLVDLSIEENTTLFAAMLAAFDILLCRYCSQRDIVVGAPVAGRNRSETEALIGCFLNTLALRVDLSGQPTFRELLAKVHDTVIKAHQHQYMPFEKLVEELKPRRDLERHPLFDVMFNFINTPHSDIRLPGLAVKNLVLDEPDSKFRLTLYAYQDENQIHLRLVYQRDLFSKERMEQLLDQYRSLLEQIAVAPEKSIDDYSLLTEASQRLLPDPTIALAHPHYDPISVTFHSVAEKLPKQIAISQGERDWSYRELEKAVEFLAKALAKQGIGDVVAVSGIRSFGLIASMMAVFASGGILLTVDPAIPDYRRQIILKQANAKRLLWVSEEDVNWGLPMIRVLPDSGYLEDDIDCNEIRLPQITPSDAAYVFFTSGTSGIPKGVLGTHEGLAHFLAWQRKTFSVGQGDRAAQLTALTFDVVLRDIFLPLSSGATLCLPQERDLAAVLPWLEREQITLLHAVPSLARSWLLQEHRGVSLNTLRQVFFAGEPLPAALVNRWREAFPESGEIANLYGPTETTLAKCCYRLPKKITSGIQPIGRPLPESQALILSENGRLCGIGESGEIVLRTPFRTLGYLEGTGKDDRFAINPFRDDANDIVYHTGDRGRYLPDGSLTISGRLDRQIKIRGIRIEPAEVQAHLAQHPSIREAAVVVRSDESGDPILVAYLVIESGHELNGERLREFLKQRLPIYMLPTGFVALEKIPLTAHGKIDERALPAPTRALSHKRNEPRDAYELELAKIWQEIFARPVGVFDDFFELGGDSLMSVIMMEKIRSRFAKNLPAVTLFKNSTIDGLAKILRNQADVEQGALVAIRPGGALPPLFCVHPLGGTVMCYLSLARHLGDDLPVYGLQVAGLDSDIAPHARIEEMAAHYIGEIRSLRPKGPYLLAGWSFGGRVAFEMAHMMRDQGQEPALLALIDAGAPSSPAVEDPELVDSYRDYIDDATILVYIFREEIPLSLEHLRQLDADERLRYVMQKAKEAKILPADFGMDRAHRLLKLCRSDVNAAGNYRARPYKGQATLFCAKDKQPREIESQIQLWRQLCGENLEVLHLPGTHQSIVNEPCVQELAESLGNKILRVLGK